MDRVVVRRNEYRDSAFLMRIGRELKRVQGIEQAEVLMGTPMNRSLLAAAGFPPAAVEAATPMDLVVAIRGRDEAAIDAAGAELARLFEGGDDAPARAGAGARPALAEALAATPDANCVTVAVPGAYAAYVANRALDAGRSVFLFSDNVALPDEVALKRRAAEAGLLVMGPDCGTAILSGVGFGFANRVPRGPVGIVGASGTGTQEVSCLLAHSGVGVSHAIGTGSRDLSREVGGAMTRLGLELLAADSATRVIALVAKHPHAEVEAALHPVLRDIGKPVVVRYLGDRGRGVADGVTYASSLDETADIASTLAGAEPHSPALPSPATPVQAGPGRMVGLFGGGSLAAEARLVLEAAGVRCRVPDRPLRAGARIEEDGNLVVDTGDDFYTVGRPHPMIDQAVRCELIRTAGADESVGVLLLDLVLGDGSHLDPAPEIAAAVADARAARGGRPLAVACSVCGTDADPQGLIRQASVLALAGVRVEVSAARAARSAAVLIGGAR